MPRSIVLAMVASAVLGVPGGGERSTLPRAIAAVTPPVVASMIRFS